MNKLYNINDLSKTLKKYKRNNKKICLCHGVFDLVHIGHIRHFKQCKKKSDILIVSITSDDFVNKGPDKPLFNENLRAEMIAGFEFIDYVVINRNETSIKIINLFKPDYYGKGIEYKKYKNDFTGNISKEVLTVKKNGGKVIYTDEITFSSSKLSNVLIPEKKQSIQKIFNDNLENIYDEINIGLSKISKFKVLFIGETIIDVYKFVQGVGKPPKEDIISTLLQSNKKYFGGIIAAAKHLQDFCKKVDVLTNIDDFKLIESIVKKNSNLNIIKVNNDKLNQPITKTRYLSKHFNKKLFETYNQINSTNSQTFKKKTKAFLNKNLKNYDLVIVLDFGHGFLDDNLIKIIQNKSKYLGLNVQTNSGNYGYNLFTKYKKVNLLCIDNNEIRLGTKERFKKLEEIMPYEVSKSTKFDNLIITCGKDGCLSYSKKDKKVHKLPPLTTNPIDTMGAGDAFISIASAFSKLGMDNLIVSLIGNIAGSLKVNIVGHEKNIKKSNFVKYLKGLLI